MSNSAGPLRLGKYNSFEIDIRTLDPSDLSLRNKLIYQQWTADPDDDLLIHGFLTDCFAPNEVALVLPDEVAAIIISYYLKTLSTGALQRATCDAGTNHMTACWSSS